MSLDQDTISWAARASAAILCSVGAAALFGVWLGGKPHHRLSMKSTVSGPGERRDPGWLFCSGAALTWALSSMLSLYLGEAHLLTPYLKPIFSTLNNAFLLLAATSFDYARAPLKQLVALTRIWVVRIVGTAVIVAVFEIGLAFFLPAGASYVPDLILTLITAVLLAVGFFDSFRLRHLEFFAWLAVAIVGSAAVAQMGYTVTKFYESSSVEAHAWFPYCALSASVTDVALVMLFLSLAYSWAHEAFARVDRIVLTDQRVGGRWLVIVDIPDQAQNQQRPLAPKPYAILRLAAQRKKYGTHGGVISMDDYAAWDGRQFQLTAYADLTDVAQQLGYTHIPLVFQNDSEGSWQLRCEPSNIAVEPAPPSA